MENWSDTVKNLFRQSSVGKEYLGAKVLNAGGYYITSDGFRYRTSDGKYYFTAPETEALFNGENIVGGSIEITQSISDADQLTYGSVEPACLKFQLAGQSQEPVYYRTSDGHRYITADGYEYVLPEQVNFGDLAGVELVLTQQIAGNTVPVGVYIVESCKKENDTWFRNVVAYDRLSMFSRDVADWYNAIAFTPTYPTIKQLRESLCSHIGVPCEGVTLPNDNVVVEKTIEPAQLPGTQVLQACCELSGCWPQMSPVGALRWITLGAASCETFDYEVYDQTYRPESTREDYTCAAINGVVIRETENDIGGHSPATLQDNPYIIQGNFLAYGKSTAELSAMAARILSVIGNKPYKPHSTAVAGRPYLQCGDRITVRTNEETYDTYILKRTLTGESGLVDTYEAKGKEKITQSYGLSYQITQLKGKTNELIRTVDGTISLVSNLETGVSEISQTVKGITSTVSNLSGAVSKIDQYVDGITLTVTNNAANTISTIKLKSGDIDIASQDINLTGLVKFTNLKTSGQTEINGGNIMTNTITAAQIASNTITADQIAANTITADQITANTITATQCDLDNLAVKKLDAATGTFSGTFTVGSAEISMPNEEDVEITAVGITLYADSVAIGDNDQIQVGEGITFSPWYVPESPGGNKYLAWNSNSGDVMYSNPSSAREKKDIRDIGDMDFSKLRPVRFVYKFDAANRENLSFVAEELESILPEAVTYDSVNGGLFPDGVDLMQMIPVIVHEVQKLRLELEVLRNGAQ